jgi:hypothetical protein
MVSAIISSGEKGDADLQAVRTCGERTKEWSLLVNVVVASSRGRYCRKGECFCERNVVQASAFIRHPQYITLGHPIAVSN